MYQFTYLLPQVVEGEEWVWVEVYIGGGLAEEGWLMQNDILLVKVMGHLRTHLYPDLINRSRSKSVKIGFNRSKIKRLVIAIVQHRSEPLRF
jgi:hypothetical protein